MHSRHFLQERLQKEAFATLLFQRDAVQSRLMDEISELEQQLSNLSMVEAKKTKLKMDQDQVNLTGVLAPLCEHLF